MIDKIKEFSKLFSVSSYEKELLKKTEDYCKEFCDECFYDNIGNLICHKKGESKKIMINIPVSDNGIFITHIEKNGMAKFQCIGNFEPIYLLGKKVKNVNNEIVGTINKTNDSTELSVGDLSIDFGTSSDSETEMICKVGDVLAIDNSFLNIGKNIYTSSSSSSQIYIATELIKNNYKDDLYFVFSVMDNLGYKGAKVAVNNIKPDEALIISKSDTENKNTQISLGKGPVVRIKDSHIIVNPILREKIVRNLSEHNIPFQLEIVTNGGITNNEIMYSSDGVLTADINIPVIGLNTFNEGVNVVDIKNIIKGLKLILESDL